MSVPVIKRQSVDTISASVNVKHFLYVSPGRVEREAGKGTVQPSMVKTQFDFTAQSEGVLNI